LQKFYSFLGKIKRLHLLPQVASTLNPSEYPSDDYRQDAGRPADNRRNYRFIHRCFALNGDYSSEQPTRLRLVS
jgi:hypothetical protein